uniref:Uncharacterized protein AlNc14C4G645 n=1 Tax=Albugo laibachii Nc14 TaxID=890382 RepID=F0W0K3_9STRA|nr:conserved hypothetical protein [Albugo laibachii Nc14]|eukprot:CCA14575.1 conserved hypothetical protein [Albugo laibachii Nc14]
MTMSWKADGMAADERLTPPAVQDDLDKQEYGLKDDVEIAAAILPPLLSKMTRDANLQTFDVDTSSGLGVFIGSCGRRLYLLNVLHSTKSNAQKKVFHAMASSYVKRDENAHNRLYHVTLEPPLNTDEISMVERIDWNSDGTWITLVSPSWVKIVLLPKPQISDQEDVLQRVTSVENGPKNRRGCKSPAVVDVFAGSTSSKHHTPHLCVTFEDGSTQMLSLDEVGENFGLHSLKTIGFRTLCQRVQIYINTQISSGSRKSYKVVSVSEDMFGGQKAIVQQIGGVHNVIDAIWHPLSSSHLAVISDSDELLLFNVVQDTSVPEQKHTLNFPTAKATHSSGSGANLQRARTVGFSFGQRSNFWDIFACYILRSDGAVYVLCPLVPYESKLHGSIMKTLRAEVDAQLELYKRKCGNMEVGRTPSEFQAHAAVLKSQKYWLKEAWACCTDNGPVSPNKVSSKLNDYYHCLKPHNSGISPETWPLALQGAIFSTNAFPSSDQTEKNVSTTARSLLYIPYNLPADPKAPVNTLLALSYSSGHIKLQLLDQPVRPRWKSSSHTTDSKLTALLLDSFHLGIDMTAGSLKLECDPNDQRLIYGFHPTGIHVMNLDWIFRLVSGKSFEKLPHTSVRQVFSLSPQPESPVGAQRASSKVIGVHALKNVLLGHFLLVRLASGSFEVVNISATAVGGLRMKTDVFHPDMSAKREVSSFAKSSGWTASTRPFVDILEEKAGLLASRGMRVSGTTRLEDADESTVKFALERVRVLYEDIGYMDELNQAICDRNEFLREITNSLQDQAQTAKKSISGTKESAEKLDEKLKEARSTQQKLQKRAACVIHKLREKQPQLSQAELQYRNDLEDFSLQVRRLKPRVDQICKGSNRLIHELEARALSREAAAEDGPSVIHKPSCISDDKKRMCYDVLRAETELIEDAGTLLEDLKANMAQLVASKAHTAPSTLRIVGLGALQRPSVPSQCSDRSRKDSNQRAW